MLDIARTEDGRTVGVSIGSPPYAMAHRHETIELQLGDEVIWLTHDAARQLAFDLASHVMHPADRDMSAAAERVWVELSTCVPRRSTDGANRLGSALETVWASRLPWRAKVVALACAEPLAVEQLTEATGLESWEVHRCVVDLARDGWLAIDDAGRHSLNDVAREPTP